MLVGMMLGLWGTAGIAAQDATPGATPVGAGPRLGGDLEAATSWLMSQQLEDGAFAGFSGEADAGTTVDAIFALVAARSQGVDTGTSIDDAITWLSSGDVALVYQQTGVGQASKLVLALVAAGENPEDFATTNPLDIVKNGQAQDTGIYGTGIYDHTYALMGLSVTGSEIPTSAIDALEAAQAENGGWAFDGSTDVSAADSNTTSMVIQALVATGNGDHAMVDGGLEFLLTTLDDEGGAGYAPGSEADSNSTALVAQANIAAGRDGTRSLASLQQFQLPSGAYFYQYADPSENLFSTLQAIPALSGVALPVMPAASATPAAFQFELAA
jgi:hypothetical protein